MFRWQLALLVLVAGLYLAWSDNKTPSTDKNVSIASTVRRLINVLIRGLRDLYGRVYKVKRDLVSEEQRGNRLREKVKALADRFNATAGTVDKKIADLEKSLLNKMKEAHDDLNKLVGQKTKEFSQNLIVVNNKLNFEKLSLAQMQVEFAEGAYKINRTIERLSINSGDVRIVGGTSRGKVQIRYMGEWSLICDDKWTKEDANVTCHMLGYNGGDYDAFTDDMDTSVLVDDMECTGRETTLSWCPHTGHNHHKCMSKAIAAVDCEPHARPTVNTNITETVPPTMTPSNVITRGNTRLVGGGNGTVGRVEVLHDGKWGTVCDDYWSKTNAKIVCKSLNLPYQSAKGFAGNEYAFSSDVADGTPIWLDDVRCLGIEWDVSLCIHDLFGSGDCDKYENAGVKCE